MDRFLVFFLVIIPCISFYFLDAFGEKQHVLPSKSIQLVGVKIPLQNGYDGRGIKVGIIDTGIDFNHPDLHGYGLSGKVIGGYDYVNTNEKPLDINGHGTEVAGIVAANGSFSGMAPESQLFSYKVSSNGEAVSSEYIIKAVSRAIEDKVNVINISLGVNRTNDGLEKAVDQAKENGIVVVVAAGNNGPESKTIGSPGRDINAITVGASYNNITSSLVSTLEIGNKRFTVLPMLGVKAFPNSLQGKIVYGGYGRLKDLQNLDLNGSILLEQRGSNIRGEKIFFSEKELNAVTRGAKGLVIFNNQSGFFFGELTVPNSTAEFNSKIPVISMSGEEGIKLKSILTNKTIGRVRVFQHPDFVAPFSSRGPASPFYLKPDLVAPGVFVNSTTLDGEYNLTSGTSFAAPHVTGAVAILLQRHPNLDPPSVASIIVTTTDPVTDPYGNEFPIEISGSGRLNVTRAFSADLIFNPHSLVFNLSYDNTSQNKILQINSIENSVIPKLNIYFSSNESSLGFNYSISNNTINAQITEHIKKSKDYEGFIVVDDSKTTYRIPVIIHFTKGTLKVSQKNDHLDLSLDYPKDWSYAKISLMKAGSHEVRSTSILPQITRTIPIHSVGEYWIEAEITTSNGTDYAYQTLIVSQFTESSIDFEESLKVPVKQIIIISSILCVIIIVGLVAIRI
jgi:minor extracellular serine protease Vpr